MAQIVPSISISFIMVLREICACIGLPEPWYAVDNAMTNLVYVIVRKKNNPHAFFLYGKKRDTIDEAFESAAKRMVLFLVRKYNIAVMDVNFEIRKDIIHGVQLFFRMKRDDYEAVEQMIPSFRRKSLFSVQVIDISDYTVEVDFMHLLHSVIHKNKAGVTPIEVISLDNSQYRAWFTLKCVGNEGDSKCLIGDCAPSSAAAKQALAKKAVAELVGRFHLQIKDVNYYFLSEARLTLKVEREKYIALKERIHGLPENIAPQPLVIEQDCLTPRGPNNTIVVTDVPPLPPKKRKWNAMGQPLEVTIPEEVVPSQLETIFKHKVNNELAF